MPQSRSTALPKHQRKEGLGTNTEETNATYETTDAQKKKKKKKKKKKSNRGAALERSVGKLQGEIKPILPARKFTLIYWCSSKQYSNGNRKKTESKINIRQVPREVLKTAASGLGFQHLPRDLANVNAWKTMFDPYIIAQKAVSHVINSRALTGEKPCINKAIHALLMHGYASFNMIVPEQICCRNEMCTARP